MFDSNFFFIELNKKWKKSIKEILKEDKNINKKTERISKILSHFRGQNSEKTLKEYKKKKKLIFQKELKIQNL